MASVGFVSSILQKSSTATSEQQERIIAELHSKAHKVEDDLKDMVLQNYQEFKHYHIYIEDLSQQITRLESDYAKVSKQIEEDTTIKLLESAGKRQEIARKLAETTKLIGVVSSIECTCRALDRFGIYFKEGCLLEAAKELAKSRESLQKLNNVIPAANILITLKAELSQCTSSLHVGLAKEIGKVLAWSASPTSPSTLDEALAVFLVLDRVLEEGAFLFEAAALAGKMEGHARELAALVVSSLVEPLVRWPLLKLVLTPGPESKTTLTLSKRDSPLPSPSPEHLVSVLEAVTRVLRRVRAAVGPQQGPAWMRAMGRVLFPALACDLQDRLLLPLLPSTQGQLQQFAELAAPLEKFELAVLGLGVAAAEECSQLSRFVACADQHFSVKQNQDLLERGRGLLRLPLLSSRPGSLVRVGADSAGARDPAQTGLEALVATFPSCLVSSSVHQFSDLVVATSDSDQLPCQQAFISARCLVELFLSVMPAQHGALARQNTRAAIVYHNNHLYLADRLAHIALWTKTGQSKASATRSFIHFIPVLRYNGEKVFLEAMVREKEGVLECLGRAGGVGSSADDQRKALVSRCLQQALQYVAHFQSLACDALPPRLAARCAGSLLDTVAGWLCQGIADLQDIGSSEADVLHGFAQYVLRQGSRQAQLGEAAAGSGPVARVGDVVAGLCPHWSRLREVGILLQSNLQEIIAYWTSPPLGGGGRVEHSLKPSEVRSLIRALFQNTDKRAHALSLIK